MSRDARDDRHIDDDDGYADEHLGGAAEILDEDIGDDPGDEPGEGPGDDVIRVDDADLPATLEAVLLVVDSPVTAQALATAVGRSPGEVRERLIAMAQQLTDRRSGIDLREAGGGWRFYTRDIFAPVVERFVLDGTQTRLSRAALETLAVVAYRQPVTRARIAAVRGVNVDGVVRTLVARGLIEEEGADVDTGGILYRTTEMFLDAFGLTSVEDLPALGPLLPDVDQIDDE